MYYEFISLIDLCKRSCVDGTDPRQTKADCLCKPLNMAFDLFVLADFCSLLSIVFLLLTMPGVRSSAVTFPFFLVKEITMYGRDAF